MNTSHQTDNYYITVGEDKDKANIYQIVNKSSGVIEYDDFILPRTIEALLNLEEKLAEAEALYSGEKEVEEATISLITGDDNGTGRLN